MQAVTPGHSNRLADNIQNLQNEVRALEGLSKALRGEVTELKRERQRAVESRTLLGNLKNILGYFLSLYCMFKILTSIRSLVFGEDFTSDPVSKVLGLVIGAFSGGQVTIDVPAVSQYLTLLFIGTLSAMSLRSFLKNMCKLFFAVSSVGMGTSLVLLMTELMGLYAISSILLIRKQLPLQYRANVTHALGGELEFQFFHRWFNSLFLGSASLTILLFYAQHKSRLEDADLPLYNRT
jgi:hypothetical protein